MAIVAVIYSRCPVQWQ